MAKELDKPRKTLSEHAPKLGKSNLPVDRIGDFIGPGGKNIKKLCEEYECEINVEEDGLCIIMGQDQEKINSVVELVDSYNLVPITYNLPTDKQLSIEELFSFLPIKAEMLNAFPVGSLFNEPCKSSKHYEFVLMEITPPEFQDSYNKIVYEDENKIIGVLSFNEILEMIMKGQIYDISFKYLMLELYMAFQNMAMQENLSQGNEVEQNNIRTSDVSNEYIEKNSQKDFAKIFLNK